MTAIGLTATAAQVRVKGAEHQASSTRGSWTQFGRHFIEMIVAMMAGMMLLGGVVRMGAGALGTSSITDDTAQWAVVMAINMTIGMAAWMRYRGHRTRDIAEMSGAMLAPLAVLIGPFLAGLLNRGALLGGMHMLVVPAMLGIMLYRRDAYSWHHGNHFPAERMAHDMSH